jgi:Chitin binding Peritrophin-A domain
VFDIYQPLRDPSLVGQLQGNATPGITYPTLTTTVKTNFTCRGLKGPGWYADIEAGCQQYHRCYSELRSTTFICPPGTLFSQETLICDFWYNVNCAA